VKQWENHEQSKQHRAAVLKLKEEMMADEELVKAGTTKHNSPRSSISPPLPHRVLAHMISSFLVLTPRFV
jgi:hypothetical protein